MLIDVRRSSVPESESAAVYGVAAEDGSAAPLCFAQITASAFETPRRVIIPGLNDKQMYRVTPSTFGEAPATLGASPPAWMRRREALLIGATLRVPGLEMPVLLPENALILELAAVATGDRTSSSIGAAAVRRR